MVRGRFGSTVACAQAFTAATWGLGQRITVPHRIAVLALLELLAVASAAAAGQEPGRIRVEVRAGADSVAGATVVVAGMTQLTDADGVVLASAPAGTVQVTVVREGFVPVTVPVTPAAGEERVVQVALEPELTLEEEVTVVATTRTGRRIEDQPMRVEALDREDLGAELLGTFRRPPFALTASYTYVRSREHVAGVAADVAQTPRHGLGLVAMAENEDGRIGVELYYTGRQRLEANPYRDLGEPYTLMGVLVERRFGPLRLFANLENLTDVRQHRWDPVLRPDRAPDGRWTVDAWAPLDGRVINGGVRVQF